MNDPVATLLVERESVDRGFSGGLVLSVTAHLALVGAFLLAALLAPRAPLINVMDGMAVPLPPGGGGTPSVEPPAPVPAQPEPAPTAAPEPPEPEPVKPQVVKPPKTPPKKGLPELDAKASKKKPTPTPAPARASSGPTGTGTSTDPVGIGIGPPGPGVPGGTDLLGDWYLAGVQRKIWINWSQQIRTGMTQPAVLSFTIAADGSVTTPEVVQSCGIALLDRAAQRAILTAAPFGPLPKNYGTTQYTIQGIFKPGS